ncbi:MAG: DUF1223 domain-containing protein, partial [Bryobacteraceae bacterium]
DGRQEFVGSDARRAQAAIADAARAPKAALRAGCEINGKLLVHLDSLPAGSDRADLLLAITEGGLTSPVSRGENRGRSISHTAVVRKLTSMGEARAGTAVEPAVKLNKDWRRENVAAVVLVQERRTMRILGAARVMLAGCPGWTD